VLGNQNVFKIWVLLSVFNRAVSQRSNRMRFLALATDYDGTLAHNGIPGADALDALRELKGSGRRLILVTGRMLADLLTGFAEVELFDGVVVENGAVLYDPFRHTSRVLAPPPPPEFVAALRARRVEQLAIGESIVATHELYEHVVRDAIRELGLDLAVILNKGAVMVLPSNVDKATGLAEQTNAFGLSLRNVAGIGDAENDIAFLTRCGTAAAPANALDSVKAACDFVTRGDHSQAVAEFARRILRDELADIASVDARFAAESSVLGMT
jgi:HAD superfamily hydrolase (TIGR01484 family)